MGASAKIKTRLGNACMRLDNAPRLDNVMRHPHTYGQRSHHRIIVAMRQVLVGARLELVCIHAMHHPPRKWDAMWRGAMWMRACIDIIWARWRPALRIRSLFLG